MRIILSSSALEATQTVASIVIDQLTSRPASVFGLATGRTMDPVYKQLVRLSGELSLSWEKAFFFMLDEYLGLEKDHPSSFKAYVERHFLTPLNLKSSQFSFPPVHHEDLNEAARQYEVGIKESGKIDLQLLGIGTNGHIGFNEPGSSLDSRTRVVQLTEETRKANEKDFADGMTPPQALSMGIATILEARSLVMLATGASKAQAIKYLLNHHDDPSCPATYLKSHPHFILVLDPEAASKINLKM